MDTDQFPCINLDSADSMIPDEEPSSLLQETVADLAELQLQVEHARHHALDKNANNYSEIDQLLDGTSVKLESWIEKVLRLSASTDHTDEVYESLRTDVFEDEMLEMPRNSVIPVTRLAIAEVVVRVEDRALRAVPNNQAESVLLKVAQSLRELGESLANVNAGDSTRS